MRIVRRFAPLVFVVLFVGLAGAVEPGLPSQTAIANLAHRAVGAKNPDPQFRNPDYLAAKFLGPRETALLPEPTRAALALDFDTAVARYPLPVLITNHLLRTRHIDAAMEDALHAGARQIVILGAGFDSRGYRFADRLRGAAVFEVDFPPTQEYKKLRVKEIFGDLPSHVRFVPMDFAKDDLLAQLRKFAYSEKEKTEFIWEGVSYYLPEASVRATLRFVRDHSTPGSTLVFDYIDTANPNLNNPNSFTASVGEPMIFGFPTEGAAASVRSERLEVVSDSDFGQLYDRYARRRDGTAMMPLPNPRTNLAGICIARVPPR
jgi:methyltransferase (TIGR00027 family)